MPSKNITVNPGRMRFSIVLQKPAIGRASDGAEQKTWPDTASVKAAIDFGEGREYYSAKTVTADLTHLLTIYTYPGLDATWRVKFDDAGTIRILDIRAIKPLGTQRRFQQLHCRELVGREAQS